MSVRTVFREVKKVARPRPLKQKVQDIPENDTSLKASLAPKVTVEDLIEKLDVLSNCLINYDFRGDQLEEIITTVYNQLLGQGPELDSRLEDQLCRYSSIFQKSIHENLLSPSSTILLLKIVELWANKRVNGDGLSALNDGSEEKYQTLNRSQYYANPYPRMGGSAMPVNQPFEESVMHKSVRQMDSHKPYILQEEKCSPRQDSILDAAASAAGVQKNNFIGSTIVQTTSAAELTSPTRKKDNEDFVGWNSDRSISKAEYGMEVESGDLYFMSLDIDGALLSISSHDENLVLDAFKVLQEYYSGQTHFEYSSIFPTNTEQVVYTLGEREKNSTPSEENAFFGQFKYNYTNGDTKQSCNESSQLTSRHRSISSTIQHPNGSKLYSEAERKGAKVGVNFPLAFQKEEDSNEWSD